MSKHERGRTAERRLSVSSVLCSSHSYSRWSPSHDDPDEYRARPLEHLVNKAALVQGKCITLPGDWTRIDAAKDDQESLVFEQVGRVILSKQPLHVRLGAALRAARHRANLTQKMLADSVGCSLPSITLAETGEGGSAMFLRLAAALDHQLHGVSLAGCTHLGEGLMKLRKQRRLGRRAVAELANLSVPTLAAAENGANVHLIGLVRLSVVLGAGLRLRPSIDRMSAFWTETAADSVCQTWSTPPSFMDKLYTVNGGPFSLDPCSPTSNRRKAPVRALVHFTASDDGLSRDWFGRVYCNPPYGAGIRNWTTKCRLSVESGQAEFVIALVPARCDTRWWHHDVAGHADVFMLRGRLAFGGGDTPAPFPSAVVCWGLSASMRRALQTMFADAWHIPANIKGSTILDQHGRERVMGQVIPQRD